LTLSRSSSKVKVVGQSSRAQEESVAKVVGGATSSEGFLVQYGFSAVRPLPGGYILSVDATSAARPPAW